jgi:hypothetical protein
MKKELLAALLKVQKEIPVIKRDTQAYNYKYAPLEVIWEKVGKIINDNGFVVVNTIEETGVRTTAFHEHGEIPSFFLFSGLLKPQDRGSEITYGRRYNVTAIFNIQLEDEDDDAQSAMQTAKKKTISDVGKVGGSCPLCNKPMTVSKNGKLYCKGKYDGTCPPPTRTPEQEKFIEELTYEK